MSRLQADASSNATRLVPFFAVAAGLAVLSTVLSTVPGAPSRVVALGAVVAAVIAHGGLGRRASSAFGRVVS